MSFVEAVGEVVQLETGQCMKSATVCSGTLQSSLRLKCSQGPEVVM